MPAHAEAASEFRYRNPVIEQDTLYVAVSQSGETLDTLMAIQEIKRKGGRVLGIVNAVGSGGALPVSVDGVIEVPPSEPELAPLLLNVPLQLLAYHLALLKGCNVDQPRNLAKSVTVE